MYVNLNSDKVKKETSNINQCLDMTMQGINNVKNTVNNISMIWKGEEYKQFSSKMNSFMEDVKKFEKSLETCKDFVNGYVNAYDKLNSHYSSEQIKLK